MRRLFSLVVMCLFCASLASADPIILTFNASNPSTGLEVTYLTLTYTETEGGVWVSGQFGFNPDDATGDEWAGWTFDGAGFRGFDPSLTWIGNDVFMPKYSFASLAGLWVDARWSGPCPLCPPPGPVVEEPEETPCEIVISQQFPPTPVPEPSGILLMATGLGALGLFRRFARESRKSD
jgi:hypothetical protein